MLGLMKIVLVAGVKALERFVEYVNSGEGATSEESIKKIEKAEFPAQHINATDNKLEVAIYCYEA